MGKVIGIILACFSLPASFLLSNFTGFWITNRNGSVISLVVGLSLTAIGVVLLIGSQDKFSEKRKETIDHQFPCPVCKKDVFTWGKVPSSMIRLHIGFGQPTWARVCNNCGNVQQFTKTD